MALKFNGLKRDLLKKKKTKKASFFHDFNPNGEYQLNDGFVASCYWRLGWLVRESVGLIIRVPCKY